MSLTDPLMTPDDPAVIACRCAGILYRGSAGYTRAQTVMILINGFAFELVMLCLTYSAPPEGATVFNIAGIIISGTVCGLIVVPSMVAFAWLFHPVLFERSSGLG